ncbi:branched-chain amino acid ABC transporter permease [Actinophytocola sp.]|uniref:branched-chain amino acid ABC transporter permease n=1 Tax=Actinophytocola sp. TaxID=1872138 RepID=UPI003D6AE51D
MSDLLVVILFGITQGSIYAAVALGLVLVFGITDIVNFAHGELVTLGAFGVILFSPVLGVPTAILVTLVVVAVLAAGLYAGGFKFTVGNHLQALVLSLAVLLVVQNLMLREFSTSPRRGPSLSGFVELPGGDRIATTRLLVLVALCLVVVGLAVLLRRSWIGLALRACGDDRVAATTLGMSPRRIGRYAFILSGLLAAAAGIAIAASYPVTPLTGAAFLLKGFAVVIVGGLGSVTGALVAGLAFGVLESFGATYLSPSITNVYAFVFMIVVLLVAPRGLFGRKVGRAG